MKVTKRNGQLAELDLNKIESALKKAFKANDYTVEDSTIKKIIGDMSFWEEISVEDIQDELEELLIDYGYPEIARSFIVYRERHKNIRDFVRRKEEFINNYKRSSNTANATIDDNSNVSNKNIGILNAEIHKEDNIEISRGMITNKLKELFPDLDHKSYINDLDHHIAYKHDESSFAGAISPYTYSPKETVQAIYGKNHWLVSLDTLYDLVDCEEVLEDSEKEVYCKYPEELYVKDRASWTLVTRLTKKKRHRPLVRVKTSFGEDLVVTDNHPLIISDNIEDTIPAIEASGYNQLRVNPDITFNGTDILDISSIVNYTVKYSNYILQQNESNAPYYSCKRYLKLDRNFGYFVGFFVGDGHYDNTRQCISFTQKDKTVLEHLAEIIYDSLGVSSIVEYKKDKTNCWRLYVNSKALYSLFKEYFQIKDYAQNKNIPINILEFTDEFAKGIIEGIIDSDGTIQNNGAGVLIRLSSRECINQITTLLRYFNYGVANTCQSTSFSNNTSYSTNYTIWGVSFNNTVGCTKFDNSFKWREKINREVTKYIKYKEGWVNIDSVKKVEDSSFMDQCDYIYDITTESHTFISSNILVHNCVSISMYPFLLNGIKGIGGLSAAPKNLDSFCGMYINLIFATSAMYAGAVATSEFFVYFDYFARKEWGDDYYKNPDKSISINTLREKTIKSQIHQYFQQVIYSINQPAAARGMQSAFVNFSYFDKPFFEGMFGNFYFPDGSQPIWESLSWLQKDFMQWFNAERLRTMMTFPVESFALVFKDGEFVDKESAEFVAEEYARGHSFFTYISDTVDSLSSCCRLKNKVQTKEFSFTNGNLGIQTGSKSVITLNLNRIVQDWFKNYDNNITPSDVSKYSKDLYPSLKWYLQTILDRVYKYHIAYNELLWDMYNANLLPVYKEGFISLDNQYLTIGINGLNQAAEFLGMECNNNSNYRNFCRLIFTTLKESNSKANGMFNGHKLTFNTECVPAESLAIKNYNWDKKDGYWVPEDTNLYASYIYKPNDNNISILDKFNLHGNSFANDCLDGGVAFHCNLDHHLSKEQYSKLLKYAGNTGCSYFTFNIPNCECDDCGFIAKQPFKECPKCGSTHITLYDRIIGYLTAIKNWSAGRQTEQKTRIYHKNIKV